MKIVYNPHLKRRIKERKFPQDYPRIVYQKAKLHFFDTKTHHNIAVAKMKYAEAVRNIAISYDIMNQTIEILTIFPVSDNELRNKISSGRWVKKD